MLNCKKGENSRKSHNLFLVISPEPFKLQWCTISYFKALDLMLWSLAWLLTLGLIIFAAWSNLHQNYRFSKSTYQFSNWILTLGNSQTVSWNNDDVLGVDHGVNSVIYSPFSMFTSDLHRLASSSSRGTKSTQDYIRQRSVHSHAHNVTEDSSRRTWYGIEKKMSF